MSDRTEEAYLETAFSLFAERARLAGDLAETHRRHPADPSASTEAALRRAHEAHSAAAEACRRFLDDTVPVTLHRCIRERLRERGVAP